MASISMDIAPRCIKLACSEGEWFVYTSVDCIQEDYHNGNGNSAPIAYREGDDDDDGGYDYAPAA
ncbi:hypothetical protein A2U01_0055566 [Trifolium medium]|uniref:Uncharacterized protein n=1 Tax=Trifolium medium TaxID=97028 RepID=A0A392RDR5_9FABA|nr:hypothetical protein [Trifolium medium]